MEGSFILHVDDDADDLLMIEQTLKSIDSESLVHGYSDGQSAYEFLESIPTGGRLPSLVILDLNMPGWNGMKTLQAIKASENYKNIPVLIFTNSDHPSHRKLSLEGGATGYLTKPYNYSEIVKACSVFAEYLRQPGEMK